MSHKLRTVLINIALVGMIAELSHINSKSLLHLAASSELIHQIFAVVGAIAFSIVTIIVMQQESMKWQKVTFPIFDAILVFLGFNLDIHSDMRIYLTVFMALFVGMIMYSLGKIESKSGESKESSQLKKEIERSNSLGKQLDDVKRELRDSINSASENVVLLQGKDSEMNSLQSELVRLKTDIEMMQPIFLKSELSRVRKKTEANRTPEESELIKNNS